MTREEYIKELYYGYPEKFRDIEQAANYYDYVIKGTIVQENEPNQPISFRKRFANFIKENDIKTLAGCLILAAALIIPYEIDRKNELDGRNKTNNDKPEISDQEVNDLAQLESEYAQIADSCKMPATAYGEYYYDTNAIVNQMVKIIDRDPNSFDIGLYNVYFSLNSSRLKNMDQIIKSLKIRFLDELSKESFDIKYLELYNKLMDSNTFLDYLKTMVPISNEHTIKTIKSYDNLYYNDNSEPFLSLSDNEQKYIQEFINAYKERIETLKDMYYVSLTNSNSRGLNG